MNAITYWSRNYWLCCFFYHNGNKSTLTFAPSYCLRYIILCTFCFICCRYWSGCTSTSAIFCSVPQQRCTYCGKRSCSSSYTIIYRTCYYRRIGTYNNSSAFSNTLCSYRIYGIAKWICIGIINNFSICWAGIQFSCKCSLEFCAVKNRSCYFRPRNSST